MIVARNFDESTSERIVFETEGAWFAYADGVNMFYDDAVNFPALPLNRNL